ncbi:diguanylate cyclase [Nocardioides humilatus]|uniref:Diguanylate cyclase n=1 Tax=Nocardioides humilatus TaxID=2607660 RepID=A0A5B1LJ80_9ACTN|nr:sensor domain-containing diguanylate cyclase [Nocardioides humilatus]KAA1420795.1 diguanylate cyclase [Nocardioides humilatus]
MTDPSRGLSWRERARRVREGESALANEAVEEPLAALEDLFATILLRSFDAMVLCTREGEYLEVSDSFCTLTGYARHELLGQTSVTLSLVDPEGVRRRMEAEVDQRISAVNDNVIVRKDGTPRMVEFTQQFLDSDGLTLVIVRDVTERRMREQELERLSREDSLTGALNRRGFAAQVDALLASARTERRTVHLVVVDVDGLKGINDELGHAFGDTALVEVAGALHGAYGVDAVVGRLGGDEFAVAAPAGTATDVERATAELRAALAKVAIGPAGATRGLSVSVGLTSAVDGMGTLERLLAAADAGQYVEKRGRQSASADD